MKRFVLSVWIVTGLLLSAATVWSAPVRSTNEAQRLVQRLLAGRTPPLNLATVRDVGQSYEVEVVTPKGTLVDRVLIEKASGRMRSLYGRMLLSLGPIGGVEVPVAPGSS